MALTKRRIEAVRKVGMANFRHGHSKSAAEDRTNPTPIYAVWSAMKRRCLTKTDSAYPRYGGRGIKICKRWLTFEGFLEDMGPGCKKGLSIDRINNNGNYVPSNCRWATREEQQNNTRAVRKLRHKGISLSISQWSRKTGLKRETITRRLSEGLSTADALNPIHRGKPKVRRYKRYCKTCEKIIFVTSWRLNNGRGRFCSRSCTTKDTLKKRWQKQKSLNPQHCAFLKEK